MHKVTEYKDCIFVTHNPYMFDDIGSARLIAYFDKNSYINSDDKKEKILKRRGFKNELKNTRI